MEQNRQPKNKPTHIWSFNLQQWSQEYTMGKDSLSNKWYWETWTATWKRKKLDHYLIPYTKINSKWIKDLIIRPETIKLLQGNTSGKLLDKGLGNDFLNRTAKAKATKAKISMWNYIILTSFCTEKEIINKMKRQPSEQKKIFANHMSYKGLRYI